MKKLHSIANEYPKKQTEISDNIHPRYFFVAISETEFEELTEKFNNLFQLVKSLVAEKDLLTKPEMAPLTINEFSKLYRISRPTINRMRKAGLPCYRIGSKIFFRRDEIEKYLNKQTPKISRNKVYQ